tara:strand:- start:14488 stop:14874 length:387 start_codon:yes stop_codon:yes gene_type:complete
MTAGSLCTKTHAFAAAGSDATINSVAGRQAVQLIGNDALNADGTKDSTKARILSFKVSNNQTTAMTIDFIDGCGTSAFNGKLIHRVHVGAVRENLDFDMHGAIISDGLYVLVTGAGTKVNVSVSAQYN